MDLPELDPAAIGARHVALQGALALVPEAQAELEQQRAAGQREHRHQEARAQLLRARFLPDGARRGDEAVMIVGGGVVVGATVLVRLLARSVGVGAVGVGLVGVRAWTGAHAGGE